MSKVAKTKENLKKCLCMKCPSYTFSCKMKSMPGNVILMMGSTEDKIHAEAMFCAYEKSRCIDEEKGCICGTCELFKEYELENKYFCTTTDGK
ncbi:MAG: DUF2769 domain-containing protein [Bacillota bacterium]|nr:DUF2769 domain-containing protein [Bacillota bacterium]